MIRNVVRMLAAIAFATVLTTPALAEEEGGAGGIYTKETYPEALPSRPLTLTSGMLELNVPVSVNLSTDNVGKPVSIPLGIAYGITNDLTLGISHRTGLCVSGESNGCPEVYDDVGAEALYSVYRNGNAQVAALADLRFEKISDPTVLTAGLGLAGKITAGRTALAGSAMVGIGLTERDAGNKESIQLALQPQVELLHGLALSGVVGLAAPFDGFSDHYLIPVGAGLEYVVVHNVDVGADFVFGNLLGKDGGSEERDGRVYVRIRL